MALRSQIQDIDHVPGVDRDRPDFATKHWTDSDKIRFVMGLPQKIGGWTSITYETDHDGVSSISGAPRALHSTILPNVIVNIIGTNEKLYVLTGTHLENITPLVSTGSVSISNAITNHYVTLTNNPITASSGSMTLTISDTAASRFRAADIITLSGASSLAGVGATEINAQHFIRSVSTAGTYTILVNTAASTSVSGGGAAVVRSTGLLTITSSAHGLEDGDRVKISGASAVGGVSTDYINAEFIIRNSTWSVDAFDVYSEGNSTAQVTGGSTSAVYYNEIPDGEQDEVTAFGYGAGLYGTGLYGTSRAGSDRTFPRIWIFDRFASVLIGTPGGQTGVYEWDGDATAAPVLVTNAPTAVNYIFVSDNILVTLGASGVVNRIQTSDQGDRTVWTATSVNQVFQDDIEGASEFISHVYVRGRNLLFTETQTYTFDYIGGDLIWKIQQLSPNVGIIGPMARVESQGIAFWIGQNNFYMWRGASIEVIPSNSGPQSTLLNDFFDTLEDGQKSKCFAWYNPKFQEVWFHAPTEGSTDPDKVVVVNVKDFTWAPLTLERTAAEYPSILQANPRLIDIDGSLFLHENGTNDGSTTGMSFDLTSRLFNSGNKETYVSGVIPNTNQTNNVTLNIKTKQYPQSSANNFNQNYTVTATTGRVNTRVMGKYWKYGISGSATDQNFELGAWQHELSQRGRN